MILFGSFLLEKTVFFGKTSTISTKFSYKMCKKIKKKYIETIEKFLSFVLVDTFSRKKGGWDVRIL